jgi:hypothetical protein
MPLLPGYFPLTYLYFPLCCFQVFRVVYLLGPENLNEWEHSNEEGDFQNHGDILTKYSISFRRYYQTLRSYFIKYKNRRYKVNSLWES